MSESHLSDLTPHHMETIRKVLNRLNLGKSDPVFSFSTDCLKAGSATLLINSFLIHGSLPIKLTAQLQYGDASLVAFLWIVFKGGVRYARYGQTTLLQPKQAHNWSNKTGQFVETIVLTSQHPLQAYWLQSISPRAPHPASLVI